MYYYFFFLFFCLLMPFNCFPSCWKVVERSVDRWLRLLNPERHFARCKGEIASHRYLYNRENSWNWYHNTRTISLTCAVHYTIINVLFETKNPKRESKIYFGRSQNQQKTSKINIEDESQEIIHLMKLKITCNTSRRKQGVCKPQVTFIIMYFPEKAI